jgi:hypothetical protein
MSAAAGGAAAAATIANAIKASGAIVRVAPGDFRAILSRQTSPLVVRSRGGFFTTTHRYLHSYKGLAFYTRSYDPLSLPPDSEIIDCEKIWIPG